MPKWILLKEVQINFSFKNKIENLVLKASDSTFNVTLGIFIHLNFCEKFFFFCTKANTH